VTTQASTSVSLAVQTDAKAILLAFVHATLVFAVPTGTVALAVLVIDAGKLAASAIELAQNPVARIKAMARSATWRRESVTEAFPLFLKHTSPPHRCLLVTRRQTGSAEFFASRALGAFPKYMDIPECRISVVSIGRIRGRDSKN